MSRSIANRIAKLEPNVAPVSVPHVVTVQRGESSADALARFRAEYAGKFPKRHGLIVVPATVETPEDAAAFAIEFQAQQSQLVATARSASIKDLSHA